jgi:hypothetical protein
MMKWVLISLFLFSKSPAEAQSCEARCGATTGNMSSFMCHEACERVRASHIADFIREKMAYRNTLKRSEWILIAEHPEAAVKVLRAKTLAENETVRLFQQNQMNDETDAFRHFLWAAFITRELGQEKALLFTTAHEADSEVPQNEKNMDLSNNLAGIDAIRNLNPASNEAVERAALKALKEKKLIVISPQGFVPEWSAP